MVCGDTGSGTMDPVKSVVLGTGGRLLGASNDARGRDEPSATPGWGRMRNLLGRTGRNNRFRTTAPAVGAVAVSVPVAAKIEATIEECRPLPAASSPSPSPTGLGLGVCGNSFKIPKKSAGLSNKLFRHYLKLLQLLSRVGEG